MLPYADSGMVIRMFSVEVEKYNDCYSTDFGYRLGYAYSDPHLCGYCPKLTDFLVSNQSGISTCADTAIANRIDRIGKGLERKQ